MTINLITQQATTVATGELDQLISIENVSGSNFRDTIFASLTSSVISARGGNENITGGLRSDVLRGDAGEDFILSIGGIDIIDGGADFDTVSFQAFDAGSRFTIKNGQWVREDPHGGVQSRVQNVESVVGTQGFDTFTVAADFISNGDRFINLRGGQVNDQIQALGALGDVTIRADYCDAQAGVIADLGDEFARSALPNDAANIGFDTLIQVMQVRGSHFGDQLLGSDNNVFESFRGQAGDDFIEGGAGGDRRIGSSGNDVLVGGEVGGGGDGVEDRFLFSSGSGLDTIADFENGIDKIDLRGLNLETGLFPTFAPLASVIGEDYDGNATISLGGENVIRLMGVTAAELDASDFILADP